MKQFQVDFKDDSYKINYITKPAEAIKVAKILQASPIMNFGIDTETAKLDKYKEYKKAGLDPHMSRIRLLQLFDGTDTIYVFDVHYTGLDFFKLLTNKSFVAHYGIFELKHLIHAGFKNLNIGCSMLLSILVDRAERSPFKDEDDDDEEETSSWKGYGLDAVIGRLFDIRVDKKFQLFNWAQLELPSDAIVYAALDAVLTYKIAKHFIPKINDYKMQKAYKLLKDMQHVIADMELNGFYLDSELHNALILEWKKDEQKALADCAAYFAAINLNSSKQLGAWAVKKYPKESIEAWVKTKANALSFNADALASMQHLPEIAALLKYKKLNKLVTTYGESLAGQINPATGRIHCSFSLGETRTGRLSSRDPNLQNLPRESSIRNIFRASKGCKLIVADFNQIELRVAGEISRDAVIISAYRDGKDLHSLFAASVTGKKLEKVTKEDRQIAKSANFGAIYGMGATKFVTYTLKATSGKIQLTHEKAKTVIDTLWKRYSNYAKWCKGIRDRAESIGFVRTPIGKIRKLHPKEVYTKAPNTVVQGGAFEVMALAMIHLRDNLGHHENAKIVNSVHDEIILEVPERYADTVKGILETSMEFGMKSIFPKATLNGLAKAVICDSWSEGKE